MHIVQFRSKFCLVSCKPNSRNKIHFLKLETLYIAKIRTKIRQLTLSKKPLGRVALCIKQQ